MKIWWMILRNEAEKVTGISNTYRKIHLSKAKFTISFHKMSFSHCLAFLLKGFLLYLTRGDLRGCEHLKEL